MGATEGVDELLKVDDGSPLGAQLRARWLPACLAEEVANPDCPPVRAHLLGEDLVAFRNTAGTVGLIEAACPHLGAPLYYGTNRDRGVRCAFHGWKFDVNGRCIEIPMEARGVEFRESLRLPSYPTLTAAGVLWTHLGADEPVVGPQEVWGDVSELVVSRSNLPRSLVDALAGELVALLGHSDIELAASPLGPTFVAGDGANPRRARLVAPNELVITAGGVDAPVAVVVAVPFDESETQLYRWRLPEAGAASETEPDSDGVPEAAAESLRAALRAVLGG